MDELAVHEQSKYEKAWELDGYRTVAPGEGLVIPWLHFTGKPPAGSTMYDYGTGTGRAAFFFKLAGYDVAMFDIAHNCLDEHVAMVLQDRLVVANLWDLPDDVPRAEYGFCTDVMEHIPTEKVEAVLEEIKRTCSQCFFQICFHEDHFGEQMDTTLHLTVKPFIWWLDKLRAVGKVTEARDIIFHGLYSVEFS